MIEHYNFFVALLQENMSRMLMVTDVQDIIKRHQAQIITSLKDPDIRLTLSVLHFMKI
jgi:AP-2 complex subunit alpha